MNQISIINTSFAYFMMATTMVATTALMTTINTNSSAIGDNSDFYLVNQSFDHATAFTIATTHSTLKPKNDGYVDLDVNLIMVVGVSTAADAVSDIHNHSIDTNSNNNSRIAHVAVTLKQQKHASYFSSDVQIIWTLIFGSMITIGLFANLLVLATIGGHKSLHTVTNCFLLNLTVSDLVTLLFNATFNFVFMITGHWPFGHRYCVVNNFITNLTIAISVFTIMFTSKERLESLENLDN